MNKDILVKELAAIVGNSNVITDEKQVLEASKDYIGFRRHERCDGQNKVARATCVVKVKNTKEVSNVLKYLNENRVDVVPRTGGSSVTLGIEPQPGGVVLDGSEMNEIIEFSEENMLLTARCGTPLEYIENYLNRKGYTTGHSPQSLPLAHVGGLIATRSIGQFSTLYGGIEDMVVGLEVVLANGEVMRIKNVPRRSTGPDLRHVFIGNEGMLGFITEATIKVFKFAPEERWMCAYEVDGIQVGLRIIREIMISGYRPAVVRLHDACEVELQFSSVASKGKSLLLLLSEGPKSITAATGAAIEKITTKYNAVSLGTKPVEWWLEHRNDVASEIDSSRIYDMGVVADTCEISACWSEIGGLYEGVCERLPKELGNLVFIGGHSSHSYLNGTNIYFQFGFKARGGDTAEEDYMKVISIIMDETLKRGGSIAHHHGSGKYRTPWMPQEHGTSYPIMYKLKEALDPNNILNKGVILVDKK